jgi:extracellular factor (EF) 3-hydroxypalmitic acid methyl ester biosynthesis protein
MSFMDQLNDDHRAIFEAASEHLPVPKGEYLIRRGEPGGEIYFLKSGNLEVVDTRSRPEIIIAVLQQGSMVGEMAFIDNSPRSADVRASNNCEVLRWGQQDLRATLSRNPGFAAAFFENLARQATVRTRNVTTTAVAGAITSRDGNQSAGLTRIQEEARSIAEIAKEVFIENETKLRRNPDDERALTAINKCLDSLQKSVNSLFVANPEQEPTEVARKALCRELHPYLVRSTLAEYCIRRPQGLAATVEIVAHVLVNKPRGDSLIGTVLDKWLLERPTFAGLRALPSIIHPILQKNLISTRPRKLMIVNAGAGSLVAGLTHILAEPPTQMTIVDQSRDSLGFIDSGVTHRPRTVTMETVQENLAQFAMGRHRHNFEKQDGIVLHGLLEYMPERIAVSLLRVAKNLLEPGGLVVATALRPSEDRYLIDHLLSWPTVRRSPESIENLIQAAGLRLAEVPASPDPLLVCAGTTKN